MHWYFIVANDCSTIEKSLRFQLIKILTYFTHTYQASEQSYEGAGVVDGKHGHQTQDESNETAAGVEVLEGGPVKKMFWCLEAPLEEVLRLDGGALSPPHD